MVVSSDNIFFMLVLMFLEDPVLAAMNFRPFKAWAAAYLVQSNLAAA